MLTVAVALSFLVVDRRLYLCGCASRRVVSGRGMGSVGWGRRGNVMSSTSNEILVGGLLRRLSGRGSGAASSSSCDIMWGVVSLVRGVCCAICRLGRGKSGVWIGGTSVDCTLGSLASGMDCAVDSATTLGSLASLRLDTKV